MRNKRFFTGIPGLLLVLGLIFCGCSDSTDGTPEERPETPETPEPVDSAFWFGDLHDELIGRVGTVTSEEYTGDMGQIASQYVCDAINAKWGTAFTPVSGTATQAANCEYLLKMIDRANNSLTSFGTSSYATKQAIDKTAVDEAVDTLWVPGEKFVVVANSSNKAAYSADGIRWTAATLPSSVNWRGVTYGNGKFVAVTDGNKAAYSADGVKWTAATLPSNVNWYGVTYGGE